MIRQEAALTGFFNENPGARNQCGVANLPEGRKKGATRKFVGEKVALTQRVKGSKGQRIFFRPVPLCPFVLKRFSLPTNFLVMP
jgi:hypothetical protein